MPYRPNVAKLLHILIKEVISFEMSGHTSKIDKELTSEMTKNEQPKIMINFIIHHDKFHDFTKSLKIIYFGIPRLFFIKFYYFLKNNLN